MKYKGFPFNNKNKFRENAESEKLLMQNYMSRFDTKH